MYFQNENAIRIDIIRITIEAWRQGGMINEDEYYYLLAALIPHAGHPVNHRLIIAGYRLKHMVIGQILSGIIQCRDDAGRRRGTIIFF